MDDIERMYRHLVRTIRASHPAFLAQPFLVGDLYQNILPYRLHRRELGLETNQDYEMTMLELLSGARGYLVVDDRMRDVLSAEQSAREPNPAVIRDFVSSHVALAPEPLQRLEQEGRVSGTQASVAPAVGTRAPAGGPSAPPPMSAAGARGSVPTPSAGLPADSSSSARRNNRPVSVATSGQLCQYCSGELPAGRQIGFCPHCGQDLTVVHCPACGSELERGWKFCVTCGRSAADL